VEACAVGRLQILDHDLAEDIMVGCPSPLPQANQPRPGERFEIVQHGRLRSLAGGGQQPSRCLAPEQGEERQHLCLVGGPPAGAGPDGLPLPGTCGTAELCVTPRPDRPTPEPVRLHQTSLGKRPQHLSHREGRSLCLSEQNPGELALAEMLEKRLGRQRAQGKRKHVPAGIP